MVNISALPQVVAAITGITNTRGRDDHDHDREYGDSRHRRPRNDQRCERFGHQRPVARHECHGEND